MNTGATLAQRCAAIELLVVDVDGVLTDGGIVYATGGLEVKHFHVRDGFALKAWHLFGKRAAIISGRSSPIVDVRARELDIEFVYQGNRDKMPAYRDLLAKTGKRSESVCYVGDDLPDMAPLRESGLAVAVADGCPEAKLAAHYVTLAPGGRAAVREVIELILRCQGKWQHI